MTGPDSPLAGWSPSLGAVVNGTHTSFRVWAPAAARVDLVIEGGAAVLPMAAEPGGMFGAVAHDLAPGARYRYRLSGSAEYPDPASRYQPDGVHGPSMVISPRAFQWSDQAWTGVPLSELTIYELHVGTFSTAGTFAGVVDRLPALRDLGVTAIELMPVGDFPGARNWGYDGVAMYAPARCYGTPDDLRRLVDTAHRLGLAVLLDVVYNHFGPDGNYLAEFSPYYFTRRHASAWGAGVNLDGRHSERVREFFIENALHWIHEYHLDGLRLDATHALRDQGAVHFLAELAARVRASSAGRLVHVIAEDDRNLARMVQPAAASGWGLSAVWADDFHHQMRRALTGDTDGYFCDYSGSTEDLATTIRQGWFFTGQYSRHLHAPRGTSPVLVPPAACVLCLQNHDQIGNRAFGERLNHQVDPAVYRAASVLLLMLPHTPLLFMGQEWAATSPFRYFTDHHAELGQLVTEGRRREFRTFAAFADEAARLRIPDPQAATTFLSSRLEWAEREADPHASCLRLYTAALAFRRRELAAGSADEATTARALGADTVGLRRLAANGDHVLVVARVRGAGAVDLGPLAPPAAAAWSTVFTSEDAGFSAGGSGVDIDTAGPAPLVRFAGPAAVILRAPSPVEVPSV
jgi:maltooligosyltrehalose trehalohydrolase